ncbi:chromatin assembly factor 1 subunit A [Platysternon megacephalum]|uniref:Chromatin assembly factor 1 subunit A n=1 Tax=Platysternon megacephalum TaxID=55544 RepID=A0A4D9E4W3_9SAUR|nr:chromatin assembly factor 1 subunit A [Platysternon megacephalum]
MRSERAAAARHSVSAGRRARTIEPAAGSGRDGSGAPRPQAAGGGSQQPLCPGAPGGSARGRVCVPLPPRMLFFPSRTATVESVGV